MSVEAALRAITGVEDLTRLAAALGFAPASEELPPALLPGVGRAMVVGRHGDFEWVGGEGTLDAARALARGALTTARPAGVLLVDPASRHLAVSVAAPGTPALRLELDAPDAVSVGRLGRCRPAGDEPAVATTLRVADALLGRGVDHRFFLEFRGTLGKVAASLPSAMPPPDRHAFALLQLTRILFLYFVEAKGWLAARPRFLREEVDRCLVSGRRLHRDLLRPLFFGTLNRPLHERGLLARRFGGVPFLNGGLFEPHALERRWRVELRNDVVRDAFDALFERFHFTLAAPGEDRIAPDMLGRVFERVMEPGERRGSGTYYTPAPLVDALLAEAVEAWVERKGAEAARGIRLLDPAAGSGAFLLGALRLLAGPDSRPGPARSRRLRRVLAQNLFGVDRNPAAIRLAELRLWLEVISADPGERPASVEPLPNLDAVVRQGDSLVDPLAGLPSSPGRRTGSALRELRAALLTATGSAKRRALAGLRQEELALARDRLERAEHLLEHEIAELLDQASGATLFGGRSGLGRHATARLAELRHRLHQTRARSRELARADVVPWFHYPTQFADAMAAGGFDLVVGNPPWVRAEALDPGLRRHLVERYRWFASPGHARLPASAGSLDCVSRAGPRSPRPRRRHRLPDSREARHLGLCRGGPPGAPAPDDPDRCRRSHRRCAGTIRGHGVSDGARGEKGDPAGAARGQARLREQSAPRVTGGPGRR